MPTTRILLADDHEIVRRGVRALLEAGTGWQICAEAADGRTALEQTKALHPDLVIMDISMPELNGLDASRQILRAEPKTQILILTMHDSRELVEDALDAGARGYVLKSDPPLNLVSAVEALRMGTAFLSPRVSALLVEGYRQHAAGEFSPLPPARLSVREREVLQLLAEGRSTKQAASMLHLSSKTVATHRANIMRKLNLSSLSDLIRYGIRNHVITP